MASATFAASIRLNSAIAPFLPVTVDEPEDVDDSLADAENALTNVFAPRLVFQAVSETTATGAGSRVTSPDAMVPNTPWMSVARMTGNAIIQNRTAGVRSELFSSMMKVCHMTTP